MGADKAALDLAGEPLIARAIEAVCAAAGNPFDELMIACGASERAFGLDRVHRQVCDALPGAGPLAGLAVGLAAARTPWVLVSTCDRPAVAPALVRRILAARAVEGDHRAVVPRWRGRAEPLLGLYHRELAVPAAAALECGVRAVVDFLEDVRMLWIPSSEIRQLDPSGRSFVNLNTPADLSAYRRGDAEDRATS